MTKLRHPVVRSADRREVSSVANFLERFLNLPTEKALGISEHASDVLHQEHLWPDLIHQPDEVFEQEISWVVLDPLPVRAETLATRTASDKIYVRRSRELDELLSGDLFNIGK
jgi:hypothetical protein